MTKKYGNPFECYEAIGAWLTEAVPEPWDRIEVDFEIIEIDDVSDYSIVYFTKKAPNKERQFFIDHTHFTDAFFQLARLASDPEKGLFKKCQFVLNHDGRYKVNFEYET